MECVQRLSIGFPSTVLVSVGLNLYVRLSDYIIAVLIGLRRFNLIGPKIRKFLKLVISYCFLTNPQAQIRLGCSVALERIYGGSLMSGVPEPKFIALGFAVTAFFSKTMRT